MKPEWPTDHADGFRHLQTFDKRFKFSALFQQDDAWITSDRCDWSFWGVHVSQKEISIDFRSILLFPQALLSRGRSLEMMEIYSSLETWTESWMNFESRASCKNSKFYLSGFWTVTVIRLRSFFCLVDGKHGPIFGLKEDEYAATWKQYLT